MRWNPGGNPFGVGSGRGRKMQPITIQCDRCKQMIEGAQDPGMEDNTAGFYRILVTASTIGGWERFADPGETILCDRCMWTDPRYIAVYGDRAAKSLSE